MGGIYGCGYLECIGVVSGCCCKEVYTVDFLIILLFPTPLVLAIFLQQHLYFIVDFKNVFSFLFMLFLCNIANVAQRTFEKVQKLRSCGHGDIIISKRTCMCRLHSTCEVPSDVSRKLQLTLCTIMAL